jgi:hypothetical protein
MTLFIKKILEEKDFQYQENYEKFYAYDNPDSPSPR